MISRTLTTSDNVACGIYKWSLFMTPEEQAHRYTDYMDRIPIHEKWPMALLEDLEIYPQFRRRGYGRFGAREFLKDAVNHGAVCCFLKVGWDTSEDPSKARSWKTSFYASEGFIAMRCEGYEPVLMYKSLITPQQDSTVN